MAFQRDYILRMIEMMGELFRRLGDMLDDLERQKLLDDVCREQCGFSLEAARSLNLDTVKGLLTPRALFMLSELLYIESLLHKTGIDEAAELRLRSLRLLSALQEEDALCTERAPRAYELMQACENELTSDDYLQLARFFMAGEQYDHVEDCVFLSVEGAEDKQYFITQGVALFTNMLTLPKGNLVLGGLPEDEVRRALTDLNNME